MLIHRFDSRQGAVLLLHNLADIPVTVDIGNGQAGPARPWEVFADSPYQRPTRALTGIELYAAGDTAGSGSDRPPVSLGVPPGVLS